MTREELERIKSFYKDSPATKGSTAAFLYDAISALEKAWVVIANLQQQNAELLEDIEAIRKQLNLLWKQLNLLKLGD